MKPIFVAKKLVEAAQEALYVGLRTVKPGIRLNEIGKAVQKYTESQGFSVVREYCGHGVGTEFPLRTSSITLLC